MKRTQVTDLFANIKATFVSFVSILMFVTLGVGVFLGISWAGPALETAADVAFDDSAFHNFQIQYPYGLTKDDIEELSKLDGVSEMEAERQSYLTLRKDNRKYTVKMQSLGQSIDTPAVVEGKLPSKHDEMAFHAESAKALGLGVGDIVTFEKDVAEDGKGSASSGVESENASGLVSLKCRSFKISALVNSPEYIADSSETYGYSPSPSGTVDAVAWVKDSVFDASAFQSGYTIVNVRCDSLAGKPTFEEDYTRASDEIEESIKALGDELATARYDDLHGRAQKKIDDGQAELDKAEADIKTVEEEIAEGEKKLEDGREELETKRTEGQAELDDAYQKLMDGESEKADGERLLEEARAKVDEGQQMIDSVDSAIAGVDEAITDAENFKAQCDNDLADGKITEEEHASLLHDRAVQVNEEIRAFAGEYGISIVEVTPDTYPTALSAAHEALAHSDELPVVVQGERMTLGEARERLETAKGELADAEAEYDQKVAELEDGWNKYYEGQEAFENEVAKAEQELADGEAEIEEAKQRVEDGKKQVDEKKPELEAARAELESMIKYEWTVMSRSHNLGAAEISTFSDVTDSLSVSMAALFMIVGLLVSYFAVSRIVSEQITQIGTKKALGFRRGEITVGYLWYSGIAVVVGAILGVLLGYFVVEGIIGGAIGDMFSFDSYPPYFGLPLCLAIAAIELVLVLGATYLACRKILKEHAVTLLRGPKPPEGKTRFYEKWDVWDRLPLLIQTIVNNCMNDRRRVLSTIVGVAGCTALIVTAIMLNNDVLKSYDRHYENVYGFNAITYVEPKPANAAENMKQALQDEGAVAASALAKSFLAMESDGTSGAMRIVVPVDEGEFAKVYHVNPIAGGAVDLSGEGAWVSQAYANHMGAKVGDVIVIDGDDGVLHEVPILGFYEFWLTYNEMVMSRDYYEKEFGAFSPNTVFTQTGDVAVTDVESRISSVEGFDSIVDDAEFQYRNFETFSSVSSAVVLIYLVLAVLMAIVVLLNLNVMFIDEKKRELIVLMINGYSVKDARRYISYDSSVLTLLGIVVGIVLGCVMGWLTVGSMEPVTATFVKSPDAWAIIIGIVGSAILATIMALIALHRINKFNLTDINRS